MKKSIYILGVALIIILLAFIIFTRNDKPQPQPEQQPERVPVLSAAEKTSVTVYYLSEDGMYLLPISYDISATTEAAKVAVERLLAGPPVSDVKDTLINNCKLVNIYSIGQNVFLDVTSEFIANPEEENQLAIDAIAATILPLSSGEQLRILVDGIEQNIQVGGHSLAEPVTMPYLNLYGDSVDIAESSDFVAEEYQSVICYLPTASGQYLLPFTALYQKEDLGENQLADQAEAALGAMLAMPQLEGTYVWPEPMPQLLSFRIEGTTAYCDFDEAILAPWGRREEGLFQRCLVRTLISLEGISAVQITVNGKMEATTASGLDISQPLTADRAINSQWESSSSTVLLPE